MVKYDPNIRFTLLKTNFPSKWDDTHEYKCIYLLCSTTIQSLKLKLVPGCVTDIPKLWKKNYFVPFLLNYCT